MILASHVTKRGPSPDVTHFEATLRKARARVEIKTLVADKGYDSERLHRLAREQLGVRSLIALRQNVGRPRTRKRRRRGRPRSLPKTRYRRLMATHFNLKTYHQRSKIETVNSIIKRRLGAALRARTYWSQTREINLRVITYNTMILAA